VGCNNKKTSNAMSIGSFFIGKRRNKISEFLSNIGQGCNQKNISTNIFPLTYLRWDNRSSDRWLQSEWSGLYIHLPDGHRNRLENYSWWSHETFSPTPSSAFSRCCWIAREIAIS
jgi:hypothetical protein